MNRTALFFFKSVILLCLFLFISETSFSQTMSYRELQREKRKEHKKGENYGYGGAALLIGCFAIGMWLKQRQLKRTNKYGTEEFSTNEKFFVNSFMEGLANVIAVALFIGGAILVCMAAVKCN